MTRRIPTAEWDDALRSIGATPDWDKPTGEPSEDYSQHVEDREYRLDGDEESRIRAAEDRYERWVGEDAA